MGDSSERLYGSEEENWRSKWLGAAGVEEEEEEEDDLTEKEAAMCADSEE